MKRKTSPKTFSIRSMVLGFASTILLILLGMPLLALTLRGVTTFDVQHFPEPAIFDAVALSFETTLKTLLFTVLLGTPLAYILARWRFPLKSLVNLLIELPIVLPPAVAGLALLVAFGRRGLLGPTLESIGIVLPFTKEAVILAQIFVAAPFFIRAAVLGFESIPDEIEDAARVDGAAGLTLFWYVTLPLSRRALSAGAVLSWARALGEFGATILFAGSLQGRTQTMPLLVYNILERDINAAVWTSLLLLGLALIALIISQWISRQSSEDASSG